MKHAIVLLAACAFVAAARAAGPSTSGQISHDACPPVNPVTIAEIDGNPALAPGSLDALARCEFSAIEFRAEMTELDVQIFEAAMRQRFVVERFAPRPRCERILARLCEENGSTVLRGSFERGSGGFSEAAVCAGTCRDGQEIRYWDIHVVARRDEYARTQTLR